MDSLANQLLLLLLEGFESRSGDHFTADRFADGLLSWLAYWNFTTMPGTSRDTAGFLQYRPQQEHQRPP
jgi:hypothetical protein